MAHDKSKGIRYQACETGESLSVNDDDIAHQQPSMTAIAIDEPKTCRICGDDEQPSDADSSNDSSDLGAETAHYQKQQPMNATDKNNHAAAPAPAPARPPQKHVDENPLIRPCKCKGSMMYVHVDCLNRWRAMSPRKDSYLSCDVCGYRYNLYRPRYAAIVSHRCFVQTVTLTIVVMLTLGLAYACKAVHVYGMGQVPRPEDEAWREWHGPTVLWMDRVYLAAGLVGMSILGFLYVLFACAISTNATATDDYTSISNSSSNAVVDDDDLPFMCCGQANCWYGCDFYTADYHCHGDAAIGGILVLAIFVFFTMIAFGIMGAVGGVYSLTESIVRRIAGRVKERILEVDL